MTERLQAIGDVETVEPLAALGVRAFTTTRASGDFGFHSTEPSREVIARWTALRRELGRDGIRFATAGQVHGARVAVHAPGGSGWLRVDDADGHAAVDRGTAMAVVTADCVPVFVAHPAGASGILHAGWRGTAAGILSRGIAALATRGFDPREFIVHLGPAICCQCYEVGADVYSQLTGRTIEGKAHVDLRELLAREATAAGVQRVTVSESCTRCDNDRFFSHRAGDGQRQVSLVVAGLL
ncbi:MAG TPA: polyphenol oxidase family protein [Gemmatimonadaceae bacterium]|nr:polyphenol oxidase family protein [Gemmatimonadaceae bacterium]